MVKQITELTLSDFPNVYTINNHIRLVTNIPNLNPSLLGSRNRGYFIRVFNSSDAIPKFKKIYVSPQFDFYASDNTSSLKLPDSSQFKEISSLDNNYYITTDTLGVAMKWFNGTMQDIVWAYFVLDDTPHFTGKILNELNSSVTYSKDENDTITITAKDGYKIKDATLEYQPYPGAGNETLGDFTIADNKLTAAINIPDNVKNDSTINLVISGDTITDLEHINPSLKADNVTVSISGNTVNLKANSGYTIKDATLDIGSSLFGDDTPLDFTVSQDKTTATVTVTDDSLIDPSQEYNLTVHTEEVPTETPTQPTPPTETPTQPTPPTETQPTKPTETQPTKPTETQPIETNYKVDVSEIKEYIDYKADGLIITLTAKQDVSINSLRAVAELSWAGDTYQ